MLELAAGAAAEVGVVLVRIDRRRRLVLHLVHAGMVVDALRIALRIARRARRLRTLVGAGQPVLLVVEVLALVAGADDLRVDPVVIGIVGDGEGADRRTRQR